MEKLSPAMENYLKAIYTMCRRDTTTRVIDIAAHMNLSKASVCRATNFLSDKGLIQKGKYREISLTAEGRKQAELITNKYDIIQSFLNEILQIDPSVAGEDACSFEHSISLQSLQSMHRYLEDHTEDHKGGQSS
jgi:Mn-dependent DtxR family transcriptional regulator